MLVQCKCIGAVTQIVGFSHAVRCQVCRNTHTHTHTFSNMPSLCAIHSAKKLIKERKKNKGERSLSQNLVQFYP